jgi:hypothetical protein
MSETVLLYAMSTRGYAYALMSVQENNILVFSSSQMVERLTKHDIVMLIAL